MTLPILILSLAGCEARRAPLLAWLDARGLPHEVLEGVDARRGLPPAAEAAVDRAAARALTGRDMADTELGCALSHRAAQALVGARGWPGALILEDDARPRPAFAALARGTPPAADLVQLAYNPPARVRRGEAIPLAPGLAALRLAHGIDIAAAYWVSARGAAALVAAATPVRRTADWPLDTVGLGACIAAPRPVAVADLPSTIATERRWAELGLRPPKKRLARLVSAAWWRRQWRKRGSEWRTEAGLPLAPEDHPA
jgi:glycosyl transferase family 25